MTEPAQGPSGVTYERSAILEWLASRRSCPVTQAPLRRRHISPNLSLRLVMETWLDKQGFRQGQAQGEGQQEQQQGEAGQEEKKDQ
jgi:hypothetical protein